MIIPSWWRGSWRCCRARPPARPMIFHYRAHCAVMWRPEHCITITSSQTAAGVQYNSEFSSVFFALWVCAFTFTSRQFHAHFSDVWRVLHLPSRSSDYIRSKDIPSYQETYTFRCFHGLSNVEQCFSWKKVRRWPVERAIIWESWSMSHQVGRSRGGRGAVYLKFMHSCSLAQVWKFSHEVGRARWLPRIWNGIKMDLLLVATHAMELVEVNSSYPCSRLHWRLVAWLKFRLSDWVSLLFILNHSWKVSFQDWKETFQLCLHLLQSEGWKGGRCNITCSDCWYPECTLVSTPLLASLEASSSHWKAWVSKYEVSFTL